MIDKALYYFEKQDYIKSLDICEQMFAEKTRDKMVLKIATYSSLKLENVQKARLYAQKYFKQSPLSQSALLLAKSYNLSDANTPALSEEALKLLLEFQESTKDNEMLAKEFTLELFKSYKNLGKNEEAVKAVDDFMQIFPHNLELWQLYIELFEKSDFQKTFEITTKCYSALTKILEDLKSSNVALQDPALEATPIYKRKLQTRLEIVGINDEKIKEVSDFINTRVLVQQAFMLFKLNKYQESLKFFYDLQFVNEKNADFWGKYAKPLEYSGDYQNAYNAYQNALKIDPHPTYSFDCAYLLMRTKNYKEGVSMYESRLFYAHLETFSKKHYDIAMRDFKQNPNVFHGKTICVYCEQGFGDTMMYSRCLYKLCKVAKEVIFAPQTALYRVFVHSLEMFAKHDKEKALAFQNLRILSDIPTQFDYAIPICSIPLICDISTSDEISKMPIPIFKPTMKRGKKKKVGIFFFTEMAKNNANLLRNCDVKFILEALKGVDCEIISFQVGEFDLPKNVINKGKDFKDWLDTYEALREIDCLITIDSAISHLSLSLDIPTIVILSNRFDWRWGLIEAPKSYFYTQDICLTFKDWNTSVAELKDNVLKVLEKSK